MADHEPLVAGPGAAIKGYGGTMTNNNNNNNNSHDEESQKEKFHQQQQHQEFKPIGKRAFSFHEVPLKRNHSHFGSPGGGGGGAAGRSSSPIPNRMEPQQKQGVERFLYYLIYALVNVIISAPSLYGYAAVIFNHPIFNNQMNALSKLVIFSSLIHQLGFLLFSSLDFSIGTVQDAGLIFLSSMANTIADRMIDEGHSQEAIVSTTLVLLCGGTALLGVLLIIIGKLKLADAVSYLPMPVVSGYLAFIGYFCFQAGISLCISRPLVTFSDWQYVANGKNLLLAFPGLVAGLVMTLTSRLTTNPSILPIVMVMIPALFYLVLFMSNTSLEEARTSQWVGAEAPSVPIQDLFHLVDFSLVRWDLAADIFGTWIGMVFVVSFASCLDVAAISMDMGEALDTNRELATVGICNLMSGLSLGFTGSYIFSQTIFTYRTGVHSRWIGVLIMFVFFYIVASPVNILQISPLFFLGATLIFIGYDLLYEWLWEIRHQVFFTEYGIIWLTFVAIQVVGIDAGIILGVLIAILEQVVLTAQTSSVIRVKKRSRAVWSPADSKALHDYAYNSSSPKIVSLELHGTIFFGSALNILNNVIDDIGLSDDDKILGDEIRSPHASYLTLDRRPSFQKTSSRQTRFAPSSSSSSTPRPPKFVVLDLMYVTNLDASATRGCFLQLAKMCAKRGIVVCASGCTPRIEWMFRSHDVSYDIQEENQVKARYMSRRDSIKDRQKQQLSCEKVLLFVTVTEALEFSETSLLCDWNVKMKPPNNSTKINNKEDTLIQFKEGSKSLAQVIANILKTTHDENKALMRLNDERYHDVIELPSKGMVFEKDTHSDSFYIVLKGTVANYTGNARATSRQAETVISGAGIVQQPRVGSFTNLMELDSSSGIDETHEHHNGERKVFATIWPVGGVFGYVDFLLERPRTFRAVATSDDTKLAKFSYSHMNLLKAEDPALHALIQQALLHASTLDLANCTCDGV